MMSTDTLSSFKQQKILTWVLAIVEDQCHTFPMSLLASLLELFQPSQVRMSRGK